jgi:hypothetical protein
MRRTEITISITQIILQCLLNLTHQTIKSRSRFLFNPYRNIT